MFSNAFDEDRHVILKHVLDNITKETCRQCNQNLIKINGILYVRHNDVTCIKQILKFEDHDESQIINASVSEAVSMHCVEGNSFVESIITSESETDLPEKNVEPLDQHEEERINVNTSGLKSSEFLNQKMKIRFVKFVTTLNFFSSWAKLFATNFRY